MSDATGSKRDKKEKRDKKHKKQQSTTLEKATEEVILRNETAIVPTKEKEKKDKKSKKERKKDKSDKKQKKSDKKSKKNRVDVVASDSLAMEKEVVEKKSKESEKPRADSTKSKKRKHDDESLDVVANPRTEKKLKQDNAMEEEQEAAVAEDGEESTFPFESCPFFQEHKISVEGGGYKGPSLKVVHDFPSSGFSSEVCILYLLLFYFAASRLIFRC
jgi:hypothetical protein